MDYNPSGSFFEKSRKQEYIPIIIIDIDQTIYKSEYLSNLVIYGQEEMIKEKLQNTDICSFEDLHKIHTKTKLIKILGLKKKNTFFMNYINIENPKIDFQKAKNIDLLRKHIDKIIIGFDTNSPKIYSSKILQKIGLSDLYDFILFDSGKPGKAYERFYKDLLKERIVKAIHIGDSLRKDIIPFQKNGGKGIHYTEFTGKTTECPNCDSDFCTDDFEEIINYIKRLESFI